MPSEGHVHIIEQSPLDQNIFFSGGVQAIFSQNTSTATCHLQQKFYRIFCLRMAFAMI